MSNEENKITISPKKRFRRSSKKNSKSKIDDIIENIKLGQVYKSPTKTRTRTKSKSPSNSDGKPRSRSRSKSKKEDISIVEVEDMVIDIPPKYQNKISVSPNTKTISIINNNEHTNKISKPTVSKQVVIAPIVHKPTVSKQVVIAPIVHKPTLLSPIIHKPNHSILKTQISPKQMTSKQVVIAPIVHKPNHSILKTNISPKQMVSRPNHSILKTNISPKQMVSRPAISPKQFTQTNIDSYIETDHELDKKKYLNSTKDIKQSNEDNFTRVSVLTNLELFKTPCKLFHCKYFIDNQDHLVNFKNIKNMEDQYILSLISDGIHINKL
jgi:hypothetical protein